MMQVDHLLKITIDKNNIMIIWKSAQDFESKYIIYNRSEHIGYQTFIKKVRKVSYISNILIFFSNNMLDAIASSFVTIKADKFIDPYSCPYISRKFDNYRSYYFFR